MSPRSSRRVSDSITGGRVIQCASASAWTRWRTARSFPCAESSSRRVSALRGSRRSTHAVIAAIQSRSFANSKRVSVSESRQAPCTTMTASTPEAESSGRRSFGPNVLAIAACSSVIHGCGLRARSHRWTCESTIKARVRVARSRLAEDALEATGADPPLGEDEDDEHRSARHEDQQRDLGRRRGGRQLEVPEVASGGLAGNELRCDAECHGVAAGRIRATRT